MCKKNNKKEEHKNFLELCEYVKNEILELPEECKFPKFLALRLRGIHEGKFLANKRIKSMANYSYEIILLTFKIKKYDMLIKLRQKKLFKDEKHRINYMMAILESSINDIVMMKKNCKKANEHTLKVELNNENSANYKKKTKQIKNNKLKNLW